MSKISQHGAGASACRIKLSQSLRTFDPRTRRTRVGGGRSNVTGRYPSRKMGVTIQFESHRVELPTIIQLEHDDSVLEYFDQAPSIKLEYPSLDGKSLGVLHTPDFFVIRTHGAGWEESRQKRNWHDCQNVTRTDIVAIANRGFARRGVSMRRDLGFTTRSDPRPESTGCFSGTFSSSKTTSEPRRKYHRFIDSRYWRRLPLSPPVH